MKFTKPKLDRVHVQVRCPVTGRNKTFTVYDTTFEEYLKAARPEQDKPLRRREKQPA